MSATIKDVARLSGVSIATVSKYINGGNLKEENRINIEKAIQQLDYRVNNFARGLKMNKSMTVGIVVDSITNTFYTSIISTIEECFHEKGYSSIICETKYDDGIRSRKLDFLLSKGVDGIIIFTTSITSETLNHYTQKGSNIVVIDSIVNGTNCDFVTSDNISGAYQAVEQLILKGHKKIAIITGDEKNFSAVERLRGYLRALEDYNLPIYEELIYKDSYDKEGGYRSLKRMLQNKDCIPTALLICNYFMAVGALCAINEEDIIIPGDLSLICFDDLELGKVFKPKLTSIRQETEEMGKIAVKHMLSRIDENVSDTRIVRVPTKIIFRDSIRKIE